MAGEDDEVVVNLSGDTSTTDVVVVEGGEGDGKKTGGTAVSFNDDDENPIADLKKQFSQITGQLRTVVADNQQTKQQLHETQQRLQTAEATNQLETIENGISQVESDIAQAEAAYARAFEAGDGAAMARAQRAISRGEAHLVQLGEARDSLRSGARRQPTQEPPPRRAPVDPVEAAIVAGRMSPRSAEWIRAHPDCITDPAKNKRMLAAHYAAVADGIEVDSDDYFERIEKGVKPVQQRQQQKETQKDGERPAGDGRRPSSAATSGSGAGGGMNGGSVQVKLTAREAASATDGTLVWNYDDPSGQNKFKKGDPIGLAEMARRKHEGMKAGLYDKNAFEA
jgi:hypothetical protein